MFFEKITSFIKIYLKYIIFIHNFRVYVSKLLTFGIKFQFFFRINLKNFELLFHIDKNLIKNDFLFVF